LKNERINPMKRLVIVFAALVSASLILTAHSFGQGAGMGKRRGQGPPVDRLYNPQTVETISGVVESVVRVDHGKGMPEGVHLVMTTDKERISVHLGPAWFIDNQETKIQALDQIQVRGSRVMFQGKPAIIAAEIVKDGQKLTLRNVNGVPAWRAWCRP
jgi:hypothetical protein